MRIALVASLVSPIRSAEANGPHSVIIDLAHGLRARGHRVTVYAAAGSAVDDLPVIEVPAEAAAAAARVRASGEVEQDALEALDRAFRRLFARLRQDAPDVISQHAFDASAIELAEGLPILHTLHLPPVDPRLVAAVRATAAPLATVSRASAEEWQRAGIRDLLVLRNGVPHGAPVDMPVRPVALVAGRISPEKGTAVAIRVARRAGLDVLVVGDVYDEDYHRTEVEPLLRPREWIRPRPAPDAV